MSTGYSEGLALLAHLEADSYKPQKAYMTDWVSLEDYNRAIVLLNVAKLHILSRLDCSVWQAQSATGKKQRRIKYKHITPLLWRKGDGNDMIILELKQKELRPGYGYIRPRIRIWGIFPIDFSAIVFGRCIENH